jgi:exodeoxyribonuclease V alpha subunit
MQIKNNYDIPYDKDDGTHGNGVFNGDVGVLIEISRDKSSFAVRFEDKTAYYTSETAVDLDLAYAMTVHKSQGSEFEAVIMPMFNGPVKLYYRNLLYTAVTRAKNILIMVGKKDVIFKMVDNDKKTKRFSGLSWFLKGECTYES